MGEGEIPVSDFWTWLGIMWCKAFLEPQDVAGQHLALGDRIETRHLPQKPGRLEQVQMRVKSGAADLAIVCQTVLRGKAAEIRIVPVAQKPKHDLGGRLQPALLDGPDGRFVAHGADLRAGQTRLVKP